MHAAQLGRAVPAEQQSARMPRLLSRCRTAGVAAGALQVDCSKGALCICCRITCPFAFGPSTNTHQRPPQCRAQPTRSALCLLPPG